MTTIATDGKVMAADGLVSGNGIRHMFDFAKVVELDSGAIAGFTGTCFFAQEATEFLNGKKDKLELGEDFEALILHPGGKCECMDGSGRKYTQSIPAVAGSGGPIALGAMKAGADPEKAVSIAAEVDLNTGGVITVTRPRK